MTSKTPKAYTKIAKGEFIIDSCSWSFAQMNDFLKSEVRLEAIATSQAV
ncbi:MAG: hypothetical protein ACPHTB_04340 [Candidatus Puniceispirillaceae bacterium]